MTEEGKRPQFGNRYLKDEDEVFKHNAWDDVDWTEDQLTLAKAQVEANSKAKLTAEQREHYEKSAWDYWDKFYGIHANRFFKDRNWLFTELPQLAGLNGGGTVLEVGCGTGSTVYPIMQRLPRALVYCCDFSPQAVDLVKENPAFDPERCVPFVCDATNPDSWGGCPVPEGSVDVALFIFSLSAMEPGGMKVAAANVIKLLKPGGIIFFRDYGQFDLAQLRFKSGKCIDDDFYVRGDGTRCYFFTREFVRDLFSGLKEVQNKVDRRLQVNRGKQVKMYRCWVQSIFVKT